MRLFDICYVLQSLFLELSKPLSFLLNLRLDQLNMLGEVIVFILLRVDESLELLALLLHF